MSECGRGCILALGNKGELQGEASEPGSEKFSESQDVFQWNDLEQDVEMAGQDGPSISLQDLQSAALCPKDILKC